MSFKIVKAAALAMCGTLVFSGSSAFAQEAKSLDQLLDFVKKGQISESKENNSREAAFRKDKANQASAVKKAEAERDSQERLSAQLEKTFEENDLLIADKQKQLKERLGTLTELFGHLTSASGD
ncbi:MAG: biopolymer transport protein ExbB, partial [Halioglobus sp.]